MQQKSPQSLLSQVDFKLVLSKQNQFPSTNPVDEPQPDDKSQSHAIEPKLIPLNNIENKDESLMIKQEEFKLDQKNFNDQDLNEFLSQCSQQIADLKVQLEIKQEENMNLNQKLKNQQNNDQQQSKQNAIQRELETVLLQKKILEQQLFQRQNEWENKLIQFDREQKKVFQDFEDLRTTSQIQIDTLNSEILQLQNLNKQLRLQIKDQEQKFKQTLQLDILEDQIIQLNNFIQSLKSENDTLKQENILLQNEQQLFIDEQSDSSIFDNQKTIIQYWKDQNLSSLNRFDQNMKEQQQIYDQRLKAYQDNIDALKNENELWTCKYWELNNKKEEILNHINKRNYQIDQLSKDENSILIQRIQAQENSINQLNNDVNQLILKNGFFYLIARKIKLIKLYKSIIV